MTSILIELTFADWIKFNFDHPVTDPQWYWDIERDEWHGPAAVTISYLTRAFENAGQVFRLYSNAQVAQGLDWLASTSEYMFVLRDEAIPWPDRRRCLLSMYQLYVQCFLPRCQSDYLSHGVVVAGDNPLNGVCYMWWDLLPIYGDPAAPPASPRAEMDAVCLSVMERTLALESEACRESALHGLGDWGHQYPEKVGTIIDAFVAQNTLSPGLLGYVGNARRGSV